MSRIFALGLILCVFIDLSKADRTFPNGWVWGCSNISSHLPFCDYTLSTSSRVSDLISRLTLNEKMYFLGGDTVTTHVNNCNNMDGGNARLGIPHYMNLVETNTAVASVCVSDHQCASSFSGPTGLAASFNRTVWNTKGDVMSTEIRALNNYNWYRGPDAPYSFIGLTGFGPNINIVRDPRFGRNSELPSEDTFLTGQYAINMVRGMQQSGPDKKYLKMITGLKHYALYSVETDRGAFIPTVSDFDLYDTYLPQYEAAFRDTFQLADGGDARAVMCSYAGLNGVPSCANELLLNEILRNKWNKTDVLIVTDCGAINNMVDQNKYAKDNPTAAALSLNAGSDVDLGDSFYVPQEIGGNGALVSALSLNLTSEAVINKALTHIFTPRFQAGLFDPLELQEYVNIPISQVNSTAHHAFVLDAALQSLVLLKNDNQTLPLKPGVLTAIIGPHVNSTRDLLEDYKGDAECFDGSENCIRTISEVFTTLNGGANTVIVERGVDFQGNDNSGVNAALKAAQAADQIVLCMGIGNQIEHEGQDRDTTDLPEIQTSLVLLVLNIAKASNKKVVLVLINGGILSIDTLVSPSPAIVEAFYPGMRGAEALYSSLFGLSNRWGRLPVTIYPSSFQQKQKLTSFDMTTYPGRTYRYYQDEPLFSFGQGLTYSEFKLENCQVDSLTGLTMADSILTSSCSLSNINGMDGDAVVMLFHSLANETKINLIDHPVPQRSLVDFDRVFVSVNQKQTIKFATPLSRISLTTTSGEKRLYEGVHSFQFFDGSTKFNAPLATLKVSFSVDANNHVQIRQPHVAPLVQKY